MALFRQEADRRFNIGQSEIEAALRGDVVPQAANEVNALQPTSETPEDEGLEGEGFGARYARVRSALSEFSSTEPVDAAGASEKLRRDINSVLNIGGGGGALYTEDKNPWGETKEEQRAREAGEAMGAIVELGREQRKKDWEEQVTKFGNMNISNRELMEAREWLNDGDNAQELEDSLARDYGRDRAKKMVKKLGKLSDLVAKEAEGRLSAEEKEALEQKRREGDPDIAIAEQRLRELREEQLSVTPKIDPQSGLRTASTAASVGDRTQTLQSLSQSSATAPKPPAQDDILANPIMANSPRDAFNASAEGRVAENKPSAAAERLAQVAPIKQNYAISGLDV